MDTLSCAKGCCLLKIFPKIKEASYSQTYPFEKRKAGVFIYCDNKVLLTQSYNNYWGIPKGQMEPHEDSVKSCAERELKEETGIVIVLHDNDLYRIILDNCYIFKVKVDNMDILDLNKLPDLDSTGIGWVDFECAFEFNINFLTRKILTDIK